MVRVIAVLLLVMLPALSWGDARVSVQVFQDRIQVSGDVEVKASRALAWETLTDYGRWVNFLPDLQACRIVSRSPLRVAQRGAVSWLPGIPIVVLVDVVETPMEKVRFTKVQGNVLFLEGEWQLSGKEGALRLGYRAEVIPGLTLPAHLSVERIESDTRAKVEAMAGEILRRAGEK